MIRHLWQELLEHRGYRVAAAGDGTEALDTYQKLGGPIW
jgi:CheY-like chemotaxis protein